MNQLQIISNDSKKLKTGVGLSKDLADLAFYNYL
jgi:hypothetical protein